MQQLCFTETVFHKYNTILYRNSYTYSRIKAIRLSRTPPKYRFMTTFGQSSILVRVQMFTATGARLILITEVRFRSTMPTTSDKTAV